MKSYRLIQYRRYHDSLVSEFFWQLENVMEVLRGRAQHQQRFKEATLATVFSVVQNVSSIGNTVSAAGNVVVGFLGQRQESRRVQILTPEYLSGQWEELKKIMEAAAEMAVERYRHFLAECSQADAVELGRVSAQRLWEYIPREGLSLTTETILLGILKGKSGRWEDDWRNTGLTPTAEKKRQTAEGTLKHAGIAYCDTNNQWHYALHPRDKDATFPKYGFMVLPEMLAQAIITEKIYTVFTPSIGQIQLLESICSTSVFDTVSGESPTLLSSLTPEVADRLSQLEEDWRSFGEWQETVDITLRQLITSIRTLQVMYDWPAAENVPDYIPKPLHAIYGAYLKGFENRELKTTLYYYVELDSKTLSNADDYFPLREELEKFEQTDHADIFLLHGEVGAGKSSAAHLSQERLWKAWKEDSVDAKSRVPLLIELKKTSGGNKDFLTEQLQAAPYHYTPTQIKILKKEYSFFFIFDGWDECQQATKQHIAQDIQLPYWRDAKLLITTRTEWLNKAINARHSLKTNHLSSKDYRLTEAYIAPFSSVKIDTYLEKRFETGHLSWETYRDFLKQQEELSRMATSPVMLHILCDVLPKLIQTAGQGQSTDYTRFELYDSFLESWFEREIDKEHILSQYQDYEKSQLKKAFLKYTKKLAFKMLCEDTLMIERRYSEPDLIPELDFDEKIVAKTDPWTTFFESKDNLIIQQAQRSCPLSLERFEKDGISYHRYQFIHTSFMEHAAATVLWDALNNDEFNIEFCLDQWNRRFLTEERGVLSFLNERLTHSSQRMRLEERLLGMVLGSRNKPEISRVASTAITLLNYAQYNFNTCVKDRNLTGINIQYADLTRGRLAYIDLSGSDLSNVNFHEALMVGANLYATDLTGAQFLAGSSFVFCKTPVTTLAVYPHNPDFVAYGEGNDIVMVSLSTASIECYWKGHTSEVMSLAFSSNGQWLASGSKDHTVRLWNMKDQFEADSQFIDNVHEFARTISLSKITVDKSLVSEVDDVVSNPLLGYIRHPVLGDGDCGYTALGITRTQAAELLKENINDVHNILQYPIQEALLTEKFHTYLLTQNATTVFHQVITDNAELRARLATNLIIQLAYIDYDVRDKNIDFGYVHPRVLQAIAHIQRIALHIWRLGENQVLIPHIVYDENYAIYTPPYSDNRRVDLLFINNNHFELLDLSSYKGNISEVGIYPLHVPSNTFGTGAEKNKVVRINSYTFRGHKNDVNSVIFISDQLLASGSSDNTIHLWNTPDSHQTNRYDNLHQGHTDRVLCLAVDSQSVLLASGSADKNICIWNIPSLLQNEVRFTTLQGHGKEVTSLTFTHEEQWLASASTDSTIRLWNTSTKECIKIFRGHTAAILSLAFEKNKKILASGSFDCDIRLWNICLPPQNACLRTLKGHEKRVKTLSFLSDGCVVSGGNHDYTIRVWDIKYSTSYSSSSFFEEPSAKGWIDSLIFEPKRRFLVSGNGDGTIRFWDPRESSNRRCLHTFKGNGDRVWSLAFGPHNLFASGYEDGTIQLWDLKNIETPMCIKKFIAHTKQVFSLIFASTQFLISGSADNTICLWDLRCLPEITYFKTLEGHTRDVVSLALTSDNRLASGSHDATIRLWDMNHADQACLATFIGHTDIIWHLVFISEALLASGSDDKTIRLWNINSQVENACLRILLGHINTIRGLTFSLDRHWLISASITEILFWNTEDFSQKPHVLPFGTERLCYDNGFLGISNEHSMNVIDLSKFPRSFHWVMAEPPTLWLQNCKFSQTVGLSFSTQQLLIHKKAIIISILKALLLQLSSSYLNLYGDFFHSKGRLKIKKMKDEIDSNTNFSDDELQDLVKRAVAGGKVRKIHFQDALPMNESTLLNLSGDVRSSLLISNDRNSMFSIYSSVQKEPEHSQNKITKKVKCTIS